MARYVSWTEHSKNNIVKGEEDMAAHNKIHMTQNIHTLVRIMMNYLYALYTHSLTIILVLRISSNILGRTPCLTLRGTKATPHGDTFIWGKERRTVTKKFK